jgi:hypothetical protein
METVKKIYEIRIPWENQKESWWNEICADIVEVFGLPGGRYSSHPFEDYMLFYFNSKKDFHLCQILISDKI